MTTYSGAGYVQNLHFQKNVTEAMLAELKSNLWLDRGTRYLTLDFTVYNGNVNLFAVVKLYFEFPATGGIFPRQAEMKPIILFVKQIFKSKSKHYFDEFGFAGKNLNLNADIKVLRYLLTSLSPGHPDHQAAEVR